MRFDPGHRWDLAPAAAIALQRELAGQVQVTAPTGEVTTVAGVDAGLEDKGRVVRAAVAVMSWPRLTVLEIRLARDTTPMPYVPGLLSFRELPVILQAFEALTILPDLVLCDGQGIAHPRGLGIAAHLGVVTGLSTIGVGKSRLVGEHSEPDWEKGSVTPLTTQGQRIGTVVRSRNGVRPLFVSPGHRIDHDGCVRWVLACTSRYRLPEPIRTADRIASRRGDARS